MGASASYTIGSEVVTIQMENPTTIMALVCLGIRALGTLVLLLGLICTRDYSLIPLVENHPIFSLVFLLLMIAEYKTVWLLSSFMFGL